MSNPFGPLYTFQIFVLFGCAVLFYKVADMEDESTVVWSGLSAGIYLVTLCFLGWSLLLNLLAQAGLMVGIVALQRARNRYRAQ
jgi:hypothetical protein